MVGGAEVLGAADARVAGGRPGVAAARHLSDKQWQRLTGSFKADTLNAAAPSLPAGAIRLGSVRGPSGPSALQGVCVARDPLGSRPENGRTVGGAQAVTLTRMLLAGPVNLNHPGHYVHWGVIQISYANALVIGIMLLMFGLALVLPFPKGRDPR